MLWLFVIILAYFFFSLASFGDKLVLSRAQNPKLYVFYVGILSLLVLFLAPFGGYLILKIESFLWIFLASVSLIFSLYLLYSAVEKFDVSRVVPVSGSVQPFFVLLLSWLFWGDKIADHKFLLAFFLLVIGSGIIAFEKKLKLTGKLLALSLISSFFMALSFIFLKTTFLKEEFLPSIIWMGIFNFLIVLLLLFSRNLRKEIFTGKSVFNKKTLSLVLFAQASGGLAGILQNLAIFLAPVAGLAIINALRGLQYVFLFLIVLFFSVFLPKIFREEIAKKAVFQKSAGILLIVLGLLFLI